MRNSERYKYSKSKGETRSSSSKSPGESKPWTEVKFSGDVDLKATNPAIHKRTSKGIIGKVDLKAISQPY